VSTITTTDISNGTTSDAGVVNNNFTAVKNAVNGNLDNNNISASAAIAVSKLAAGTLGQQLTTDGATVSWSTPLAVGSFSAYKSADQTGIVSGTPTKITFDTEEWDVSGWFASSTYSPTLAGIYRITTCISPGPTALADQLRVEVFLYKNGSLHRRLVAERISGTADDNAYVSSCLVSNDGNDTFEVYYDHNAGANRDVRGGADRTFFQGEYLGRSS
jgi:hypothetical protein